MNFYDQIKSPFEDNETIKELIKIFSKGQDNMYYDITHNSSTEKIDNNEYMKQFDDNIYWPCTEKDWRNYEPNNDEKYTYSRFSSYRELFDYTTQLDATIKDEVQSCIRLANIPEFGDKHKKKLQELSEDANEIINTVKLKEKVTENHDYHNQGSMGFHFDSQLHDKTAKREEPEVKFYINAGKDSYKVAKLFLDKCREQNMESYYFKVVDPMYQEQKRTDKLCIYSTVEHAKSFLEIIKQIQKENPDINFNKPPLTTGVIDNYIGFGTDKLDKDLSYNQVIAEVIEEGLKDFFKKINLEYTKSYEYINNHPEMLEKIKQILTQKSTKKGCSKDKICVSDDIAERLKTIELSSNKTNENYEVQTKARTSNIKKQNRSNVIRSVEITDFLNPEVLKQKIELPNGAEVPARQYVQEVVAPHIPNDGKFILTNGSQISAIQYIEEYILGKGQKRYKGDISKLLSENTKRNNGTISINGEEINSVDIVNNLAPELMNRKLKLPNGVEIPATQYIQEVVAPYIPSNGKFILKSNGVELSAKQFIEEAIIFEGQDKYNGDILAILEAMTVSNNGTVSFEKNNNPTVKRGLKREIGMTFAQSKEKEEQNMNDKIRQAEITDEIKNEQHIKDNNKNLQSKKKLSIESVKEDISQSNVTKNEINNSQKTISLKNERSALFRKQISGQMNEEDKERLNEINALLTNRNMQNQHNRIKKNGKSNGISR